MNIKQVEQDIVKNGECAEALYFATSEQIDKLIEKGKIDHIYWLIAANRREEMAHMVHEALNEFQAIS
jgi:hypothetical protein